MSIKRGGQPAPSRWLENCVAPDLARWRAVIFQEFRRGAVFPPGKERVRTLPMPLMLIRPRGSSRIGPRATGGSA